MSRIWLTLCGAACSLLFSTLALAAPNVLVETSLGQFVIELDAKHAPISTANFVSYVEDGSYNGTIFHRVIPGFMAQGGGFTSGMKKVATKAPIKNEASNGLTNDVATIAMARTNNPDSATRQFFINYADNDFLNFSSRNPGYAVFGKVTSGFEVVQKMAQQPTGNSGHYQNVPLSDIVITKMTIQK